MSSLPANTSERVIEEHYVRSRDSYLIYLMHVATYRFAAPYLIGKTVLDLGCGTGYGSALLAGDCASVTGVDISAEAIGYARAKYAAPGLAYDTIDKIEHGSRLRFADASFDAVISFQVIEHVADVPSYLLEVKRLLKPGGVFIVATPDRATRLLPLQRPWNLYHLKEYSHTQFEALFTPYFANVEVLHMSGTRRVIDIELKRTRLVKWLTLPFTFPFAPEWLRSAGLALMKRVKGTPALPDAAPAPFDFDERDIQIGKDLTPSLNLVAVMVRQQ
jgi:2-polyprenyl-3-methyl-5-hydroxy-6-metoxy-1,4-benzoquinol methylase